MPAATDTDIIIVGAGLSGIAAAWRLKEAVPDLTVTILEARDALGGTWDLFRYPGVRSDSDILSYAFPFRPWTSERGLADGELIREYLADTAAAGGITDLIRFSQRVLSAQWSSAQARWMLEISDDAGDRSHATCRFLFLATGYFSYESGYTPHFDGIADYRGTLVHPQQWPADLDYTGKEVLVIGSGATAVTLVPALAQRARHVTMLQRSAGHVIALPKPRSPLGGLALSRQALRLRNIAANQAFYHYCRSLPDAATRLLRRSQLAYLDNPQLLDDHFNPAYEPWAQRLCVAPDGDLFRAIGAGRASVVSDTVSTFLSDGVRLRSGRTIRADVIVTATGLNLEALGRIKLGVDGRPIHLPDHYVYRGAMLSGVPNLAFAIGYANASWTLRADLTARYVARLIRYMRQSSFDAATPVAPTAMARRPLMTLMAGYLYRRGHLFPTYGDKGPWRATAGYFQDLRTLTRADVRADMAFTQLGST